MEDNKMTNVQILELIKTELADNEIVVDYCDRMLASAEKARISAAARRAKKMQESDETYKTIVAALTEEPQSAAELESALGIKKGSIAAKLRIACANGEAVKSERKESYTNEAGKKVSKKTSVYAIA